MAAFSTVPAAPVTPFPHRTPETLPTTPREPVTETAHREKPPSKIGRRALLLGGAAGVVALAGSGTAAALLLQRQPAKVTVSVPGPKHFVPGTPVLSLTGHSDVVWTAVWDPSGHYLATAGDDTRLMMWNMGDMLKSHTSTVQSIATPLHQWKFDSGLLYESVAWAENGRFLAATPSSQNMFYVMDTANAAQLPLAYVNQKNASTSSDTTSLGIYYHVVWSQRTSTLAVSQLPGSGAGYSIVTELWSLQNKQQPIKTLTYDAGSTNINVSVVQWSSDGSLLAGTLNNYTVLVWDVKTGKARQLVNLPLRRKQAGGFVAREALVWSPVNPFQLFTTNDDVVEVCDIRQNKPLFTLGTDDPDALTLPKTPGPIAWFPHVLGLTISPNGRYIAGSYGRSNKIYVWDLQDKNPKLAKDGTRLQTYLFGATGGHSYAIVDLAWSPDGRYLASTSYDKTVIVWKVDAS